MLANRHILCPTDFSDFSRRALEQAMALADPRSTRLTLLHVVPPLLPPAGALPFPVTPTLDANARQVALDALGQFAEPARAAGLETALEVREGSVASHVVKLAETLPADILVMGTHGLRGFERFMLGSVTERVLRRAPCPVLTVPRGVREGGAAARQFGTILCPLDFADPSARALGVAQSLARESKALLLLLHVVEGWPEDDGRDHSHWAVPEYRRFLENEGRSRLAAALSPEARSSCRVEEVLAAGKPYVEILRLAAERAADLVVMGVHGRGGADLTLFGSTAQHVVREASCPVLTVPCGDRAAGKSEVRRFVGATRG